MSNFDEFTFTKAVEVMNEYDNLKKENAELKKQNKISEEIIIGEQMEINELRKENKELKKQTEKKIEIDTAKIFELTTEINELKAQVAKQRCKNVFAASDASSQAVPCYVFYSCNNCPRRS